MDEIEQAVPPVDGPPPIEHMYRGIQKIESATAPDNGTLEADVVVIGCGGSGIPAAVSAYENGAKKVVVIEKRGRAGGNSVMARGIFACETSVLRQAMIKSDRDEIFTNAMRWHHYSRVNGRILRAWINQSGDTVEWLRRRGVEFEVGTTQRMTYDIDPNWHCVKNGTMAIAMGKLFDEVIENGASIFLETQVTEILKTEEKVYGVRAEKDGKSFLINAPRVIIASGGFLANTEMVKQYCHYYDPDCFGGFQAPNMGEGVGLAEHAGGALEKEVMIIREACAASDKAPRLLCEFTREPYLLWVNKKGRRFVEETAGSQLQMCTNALMTQPGMKAYALFDQGALHRMMDLGFELCKGDHMRGCPIPSLKEQLEAAQKKAPFAVKIADTVEELAQWIGCGTEALQDELNRYNSYCEQGYDADFNKARRYLVPCRTGPFYAIEHMALAVDTAGPIRVDEHMRVLGSDYEPVKGLYAAGSTTAGWQSNDYCGPFLFGGALSYAMNSGRIAGRSAAEGV
ncbi:MAG: flavoprotein subunit of a reductase [Oscillospiraceae bacterium]|nr:flavoprotein subunit of a reductase [Oscillospiraceae bacterium]